MFNKFDENEDNYNLKYILGSRKSIYGYIEKSPLSKNYQYYESTTDKHIQLDLTKGKESNEEVVEK
jgi:hypothetical protein